MLYRQKKDTYIRNYDGVGYITSTGIFNDRCTNESGTVFLRALSRKPHTLDELVDKIAPQFIGVDRDTIKKDAEEFYETLVIDGFIVKGETEEELNAKDKGFTYNAVQPKTAREDFTPTIQRADSDTQEFLEKHFKDKPHLTSFQIELTSRCNERCVHCYIPHDLKLFDISEELYYNALEQLSKMGVLSVTLSGGECMCHPKFKEFLRAAKNYDFYVNILSNLTLLDDEIIQIMKEGNVSSVQTSLYSMIPEHHDAITTVKGSFYKTRDNILRLIENDLPLHVSCPTMKGNKDDYGDVMKWCHEHKIRAQTDYIMMAEFNHETSNLANRLSVEECGKVISDIIADDEDYKKAILAPDFVERCNQNQFNPERRLCGVGVSSCCMVANGNVYPCAGWQEMVLGNLKKDTLENIWNNSEKIKWLRTLKMKDLGNGECCKCDKAAFCAPCLVRNANESPTGNPLEINRHFCAVAAKNKQLVLEWRKSLLAGSKND
ncbi:MAG: PqqD family peptide modification chaperone [Treponema sp.]|nr:PqqD family peptide modification chaperone [Treponema sp.]